MLSKTFNPTTKYYEKRPIMVRINKRKQSISFHFVLERNREFYWFKNWQWDKEFEQYLYKKGWFSPEMKQFINDNLKDFEGF